MVFRDLAGSSRRVLVRNRAIRIGHRAHKSRHLLTHRPLSPHHRPGRSVPPETGRAQNGGEQSSAQAAEG